MLWCSMLVFIPLVSMYDSHITLTKHSHLCRSCIFNYILHYYVWHNVPKNVLLGNLYVTLDFKH